MKRMNKRMKTHSKMGQNQKIRKNQKNEQWKTMANIIIIIIIIIISMIIIIIINMIIILINVIIIILCRQKIFFKIRVLNFEFEI